MSKENQTHVRGCQPFPVSRGRCKRCPWGRGGGQNLRKAIWPSQSLKPPSASKFLFLFFRLVNCGAVPDQWSTAVLRQQPTTRNPCPQNTVLRVKSAAESFLFTCTEKSVTSIQSVHTYQVRTRMPSLTRGRPSDASLPRQCGTQKAAPCPLSVLGPSDEEPHLSFCPRRFILGRHRNEHKSYNVLWVCLLPPTVTAVGHTCVAPGATGMGNPLLVLCRTAGTPLI